MKIKLFILIAIIALAVATWFFNSQKSDTPKPAVAKPDISAEVSGIRAVQTSEQTGEIEYELTAERLTQNSKTGQDELINAKLYWLPNNTQNLIVESGKDDSQAPIVGESYEITAPIATFNNTTGEFVFQNGFVLDKKINDTPTAHLTGQVLTGNIKQKTIASSQALTAQFVQENGTDEFNASGFTADLTTGVYEFDNINSQFIAPKRTDKPLF